MIVGGVTAGSKAAARIMRLDPDADVTIVDGSMGAASTWIVRNVSGAGAVIDGFTITGGDAGAGSGGGLACTGSTLEVTGCSIRDNVAGNMGGGIFVEGGGGGGRPR